MKMQIKEFAEVTGVSVRTLHYYDEIGLLRPAYVDRVTGYRHYDEQSVLRMQEILFYRELDFSLKQISEILSSPNYQKETALKEQKQLLTLKKERLERLIEAIDGAMKGENVMSAFDNSKFDTYKAEAKERWGKTTAYKESEEKAKHRSKDKNSVLAEEMDAIFGEFAACMNGGAAPESEGAQLCVKKLQSHITENHYNCTKEILFGLGQMYVADERFKETIDKHAAGNAEFVCAAIGAYCK